MTDKQERLIDRIDDWVYFAMECLFYVAIPAWLFGWPGVLVVCGVVTLGFLVLNV
jgi:hypothetical protein